MNNCRFRCYLSILLCLAALAMALPGCARLPLQRHSHGTGGVARPVAPHLFGMNGIEPFHNHAALPADRQEAAWEELRERLRLMKELGITTVRVDLWWASMNQRRGGTFDFSVADRAMDLIVAAGLEPYPILCYNAAWSPDRSPDSAEEREHFGQYVFETVERYRDRVRVWEVWNEPDLTPFWVPTPDARLYAELLKVAYRRAKEADPDCTVVGMCMSRADTDFLELAYRTGVAGSFDALSFHHYDSTEDEAVLENEVRRLRRVMERYGDGDKPILITELGLSTGRSDLVREMTQREQAAWIMKKYLVAQAEGVERFYYFKLTDDSSGGNEASSGFWGLFDYRFTPKVSRAMYAGMAERLRGAEFLGRGYGGGDTGDVEFQLFRRNGRLFAAAWIRRSEPSRTFRLPVAAPVAMTSMDGVPAGVAQPGADELGRLGVPIPLSPEPIWLEDLPESVRVLTSVRFEPPVIHLPPGVERTVEVIAENASDTERDVDLTRLRAQLRERGVQFGGSGMRFTVPPGGMARRTMTLRLPAETPEFSHFRVRTRGGELGVFYARPMSLELNAMRKGGGLAVTARTQNLLESPADVTVRWSGHPDLRRVTDSFRGLAPGASGSSTHLVARAPGEHRITARAATANGARQEAVWSVHGQPLLDEAPAVDGDLGEWQHLRPVTMLPSRHQVTPDRVREPRAEEALSGRVWVAWTADGLHLAAEVRDPTPMLASFEKGDLWKGDGLEFYFGFDGPTARTQYGPREYHIGISPGDGTKPPHLWNWNPRAARGAAPSDGSIPGGTVAVRRTAIGYDVEASIPLSEFLVKEMKPGATLAFNVHLNGRSTPEQEVNDTILIWNGYLQDWRDPSRWGAAWVDEQGGRNLESRNLESRN